MSSSTIDEHKVIEEHKYHQENNRPPQLRTILIAISLGLIYLLFVWSNFTDGSRRSVSLQISPQGADHLVMDVNVAYVDLLRAEMTTRISFHVAGKLSQDEVTPATNLQLVLNTVHGKQQFDFPKGERMNPIEAVFPLQGEVNFYPFDRHTGVLWFFVTTPERQQVVPKPISRAIAKPKPQAQPKQPTKKSRGLFSVFSHDEPKAQPKTQPKTKPKPGPDELPNQLAESPGLPIGTSSLQTRAQVDTKTNFTASISGLNFRHSSSVQSAETLKGLTGIRVEVRRATNVILISVASMLMMAALGVGLVAMVLKIVNGTRKMANFHVPMAVSLMFGLPALRNVQNGIPPIGTVGDSVAFIWAETAAAGSVIALVLYWLTHRMSPGPPPTGRS